MPIDFQESPQITFPSKTGAQQNQQHTFTFPTNIKNAQIAIKSFNIQFTNKDRPFHEQVIRLSDHNIVNNTVRVTVFFGLRDFSGTFDDPFEGEVILVAVVDRV